MPDPVLPEGDGLPHAKKSQSRRSRAAAGATGPGPKKRRTQAERRAETRAKLMEAAIACLLERGYAGTTTAEVAERAGVSRGAQTHHFPTKAAMLAEAVQYLADQWMTHFRSVRIPRRADRVGAVIDLLWSSFSGPLFEAAVEMWIAARTDPDLHAILVATERETGRSIARFFEEAFGELATHPRFPEVRRLSLYVMRGMALEAILEPSGRARAAALETWKELVRGMLEVDAPPARRR